uniref:Secreted protein n=1 Tax=Schistosoma curassoni TaxID=6186 RepID=A0A183L2F1_9TREM
MLTLFLLNLTFSVLPFQTPSRPDSVRRQDDLESSKIDPASPHIFPTTRDFFSPKVFVTVLGIAEVTTSFLISDVPLNGQWIAYVQQHAELLKEKFPYGLDYELILMLSNIYCNRTLPLMR